MEPLKDAISIEIIVNVPVETVWKLWTNPVDIMQWNAPWKTWHSPVVQNDLRNGGAFFFRMETRDGADGFDFIGIYDEVIMHELIEYTTTDGRKARNVFIPNGDQTIIVETFQPGANDPVELQKSFVQGVLSSFKEYAESNE